VEFAVRFIKGSFITIVFLLFSNENIWGRTKIHSSNTKSVYKVDQSATEGDAEACSLQAAQGNGPSNDGIRSNRIWYKSEESASVFSYQVKLQKQWKLYQDAQQKLLQRLAEKSENSVSRAEWESWIEGDGSAALTPLEKSQLRKHQQLRALKAWKEFQRISFIDLEPLRKNGDARQRFCAQLPKGGMLHVHPFGTMNLSSGKQLLAKHDSLVDFDGILSRVETSGGNLSLNVEEVLQIQKFPKGKTYSQLNRTQQNKLESWMFLPPGFQLFPRFNTVFSFLNLAVQDWEDYQQVMLDFARRAIAEGVIYTEFTANWGSAMPEALAKIERETGLVIRFNHSFNRTRSVAQLRNDLEAVLQQKSNPYWVGVDLLDNEEGNSALEKGQWIYGNLLAQENLRGHQLHRTQHSGELGDLRNPRDAMLMGAERLGHAVALIQDPIALEYAISKKLPLEINISSNLRLTSISSVAAHPLLQYLRLGLPVSLSTDDEGIFEIDINHECDILIAETNVTYAELKQMAINSIESSFVDKDTKQKLLKQLATAFVEFEKRQDLGKSL